MINKQIQNFEAQGKYFLPLTVPSFFPSGSSRATPAQIPPAKT